MKVLHFCKYDRIGGAGREAYRLHQGLVKRGIDSKFVVDQKFSDDPTVIRLNSKWDRLRSKVSEKLDPLPFRFLKTKNHSLHSAAWLGTSVLNLVEQEKPDLVFLHWICGGFIRLEDLPKIKCPVIWRVVDTWPFSGAEHYAEHSDRVTDGYQASNRPNEDGGLDIDAWVFRRKKRVYRELQNRLRVMAPSDWIADQVRSSKLMGGFPLEKITTGHRLNIFRPMDKKEARQTLGLPLDKKIILFCAVSAVTDPRKGYAPLVQALRGVHHNSPDTHLAVVGSGHDEGQGLPEMSCTFLGRFYDDYSLAIAYSAADVFVAPSLQENLPNTVMESLGCGTPAVAFNTGGIPELVDHQENGYLASWNDASDLQRGLEWVLEHPHPEKLAAHARSSAESRFDQDRQDDLVVAYIKRVLERAGELGSADRVARPSTKQADAIDKVAIDSITQ